ncbi:MAG: Ku protein [Acidimicrobiia bacterium]|nr:Ku protein [Acidimicrobiia bacterium]
MPRAIWSGTISFGLVSIPIKLFTAVSRKSVHFNQIDTRTNSRIKQKRVSDADGSEVPPEALAKGYQLASGEYVIVEDEELAALDPKASRTVEIEEFVDLAEIDPVFYDSAYFVAPDQATLKPYALLQRAMEESGKVGIARFVMRTKQYLAAIRPVDGRLMLSTMVYADELSDPTDIPELESIADIEISDREVAMAQQLIESLGAEFEPEKFRDTYRDQVLELIDRKASGATEILTAPEEPAAAKVVDLMSALEASVAAAKAARKRHPSAGGAEDESEAEPAARAAKRTAAKRSSTKKATSRAPAKKAAKRPAKKVAARKSA